MSLDEAAEIVEDWVALQLLDAWLQFHLEG
jgi:hypothetical protein